MLQAFYFPSPDDDLILRICDSAPCRAEVLRAEQDRADLSVTHHLGNVHLVQNVLIGTGEPDHCILA